MGRANCAPLPPGEPGPSGSPSAPAPYSGSFAFCGTDEGIAVSIYQTFWPASSGATLYGLYVKGQQEPAYRLTDSTTRTTSYIFTNIPGDGRINACNANGCSSLSPDAVVVSHQPQCGGDGRRAQGRARSIGRSAAPDFVRETGAGT